MPECTLSINNLPDFATHLGCLDALDRQPGFVELLWDNFCHLTAGQIAEVAAATGRKVALHIMWSRFLELDSPEWARRFRRLRDHVDALDPVYVSDHLCRFADGQERYAIPIEHTYRDFENAVRRVDGYQQEIGQQLLVENYASTTPTGAHQIEFLAALGERTGCGVLFDISNARVAALNGVTAFDQWLGFLAGRRLRCHVGSFALDYSELVYHDTHDRPLNASLEEDLTRVLAVADVLSVCCERDQGFDPVEVAADLRRIEVLLMRAHAARSAGPGAS